MAPTSDRCYDLHLMQKLKDARRIAMGTISFTLLASIVAVGAILTACGVEWFPRCEDPKNPCPPMPESHPDFYTSAWDAGRG